LIKKGKIQYVVGWYLFALGYIVVMGLKRGEYENIRDGLA